jgi:hypothetical protein
MDVKILHPLVDESTDTTDSLPEGFPLLPREIPLTSSDDTGAATLHLTVVPSGITGQTSEQCQSDASGPVPDVAESSVSSSVVEEHTSSSKSEDDPATDSAEVSKGDSNKRTIARPVEASNGATRRITRSRDAAERKALSVP